MAVVSCSSVTDALSDLTDSNDEKSEDISDQVLVSLAEDYSSYLKVDVTTEKQSLEETIDDLLTRLDEFSGLVDMVRSDDSLCLSNTLPDIVEKSKELELVFEKIDKLEAFVNVVKQNVNTMEAKVNEAENALGGRSVKKLLSSLQNPLFPKRSPQYKRQLKYDPFEFYKTDDYIKSPDGPGPASHSFSVSSPDELSDQLLSP